MVSRSITKLLGLSRNTVKRTLKIDNGPIHLRKEKVNTDITPLE